MNWIQSENILAEDQVGFRGDRSILDCCLVLYYLAEKYTSLPKGIFLQAFVDFNSTFDLISTERLWQKLQESSMDKRLLVLIQTLYSNTSLKVRCSPWGHLSRAIFCILASLLFKLYINSVIQAPTSSNHHFQW